MTREVYVALQTSMIEAYGGRVTVKLPFAFRKLKHKINCLDLDLDYFRNTFSSLRNKQKR